MREQYTITSVYSTPNVYGDSNKVMKQTKNENKFMNQVIHGEICSKQNIHPNSMDKEKRVFESIFSRTKQIFSTNYNFPNSNLYKQSMSISRN